MDNWERRKKKRWMASEKKNSSILSLKLGDFLRVQKSVEIPGDSGSMDPWRRRPKNAPRYLVTGLLMPRHAA
ncbi:hypothetical protein CEXT_65061 [Caerostris extrusa]|uniref:Uncharacterized protein n=1 Tax=Caerostris extrusa TaxID=172846 RepID=A0AAV4WEU7_CAEEX|nr:hypothetical protein CEXT_65061 [Caerostris extrusa]